MFPSRSPARLIVLMGWAVVSFPDSPGARPAGADDRDFARVSQRRMMGDDAGTDAPVAGTTDPPGGKTDPDAARKRRTAQSALFLIIGIAAVGLFLILMVTLWGTRLRRRMKRRRRPPAVYDPLWYLKTGKDRKPANRDDATGTTHDANAT